MVSDVDPEPAYLGVSGDVALGASGSSPSEPHRSQTGGTFGSARHQTRVESVRDVVVHPLRGRSGGGQC